MASTASRNLEVEKGEVKSPRRWSDVDWSGDAVSRVVSTIARAGSLVFEANPKKSIQKTTAAVAMTFGVPYLMQAGRGAEYWAEVAAGQQRPDSLMDQIEGTIFGPQKDQAPTGRGKRSVR